MLEEALTLAAEPADTLRLHLAAADAALAAGALAEAVEHALPIADGRRPADAGAVAHATYTASSAMRILGRHDEGWALLAPLPAPPTRSTTYRPTPPRNSHGRSRTTSATRRDSTRRRPGGCARSAWPRTPAIPGRSPAPSTPCS